MPPQANKFVKLIDAMIAAGLPVSRDNPAVSNGRGNRPNKDTETFYAYQDITLRIDWTAAPTPIQVNAAGAIIAAYVPPTDQQDSRDMAKNVFANGRSDLVRAIEALCLAAASSPSPKNRLDLESKAISLIDAGAVD